MRDANPEPLKEINIELEEKIKAWSGIHNALDFFLNGKNDSLLASAVKAFLPGEKGKKAPGVGLGLIFKVVFFAVLHPIHTFNLIKLARSPEIYKDPDFQNQLIERESFTNFFQDLANKSFMLNIGKFLEQGEYLTGEEINKLLPALKEIANDAQSIKDISKAALTGDAMFRVENLIANPKLQNILKENPTLLPRIAKKIIEENKSLKNTTKDYKFDSQILDILNIILSNPQKAQILINAVNNNDYIVLSEKILELLSDPKMVGMVDFEEISLKELIKKQAEDGLFTNLIIGRLEQDKKEVEQGLKLESESVSKKAEQFGITTENLPQFAAILPSIIDEPEKLQKILNDFTSGRFVDMSAKLVSMVNESNEIKDYLTKNSALIVEALDQVLPKVEALNEYGLKGSLYELVPHLLNHSDKLLGIIDIYQDDKITDKQKYLSIAKSLLDITKNDENVRKYFAEKSEIIVGILDQVLPKVEALNKYGLKGSLYELVPHLLNHSDKLVEIIDAYQDGKRVKVLRVLSEIIKDDSNISEKLKYQFEVNRDNIINLVTEQLEKNEKIPRAIKEIKVGEILVNIADDIKNTITEIERQKDFNQAMENKIEQNGEGKKLQEEQVKYSNIHIDGRDLSDKDYINISFDKSVIVNTKFNKSKFTNTTFKDATLENVSFEGAVIDAATLKSLLTSLEPSSDLNLSGAKLVGDLSGADFTNIKLTGVDLSEVLSLTGVDFKGADLSDAKLPSIEIVAQAYNLREAKLSPEAFPIETVELLSKAEVIKAKLLEGLKKNMLPHNKSLGEYLIKKFEHAELDIYFEIDPDRLKHVSEYKDNINLLASEIYENLDNPRLVELIIMSDLIADKITQNLFGEGENRGVDGYNIKSMMKEVIKELSVQSINVDNLIEINEGEPKLSSKLEKIAGEVVFNIWGQGTATGLSKIFYAASKYTDAGLVSGGIYLPEEAFNEQLGNAVKTKLNKELGIEITKSHQDRYSESNNNILPNRR